jgi:hypothetical protein
MSHPKVDGPKVDKYRLADIFYESPDWPNIMSTNQREHHYELLPVVYVQRSPNNYLLLPW